MNWFRHSNIKQADTKKIINKILNDSNLKTNRGKKWCISTISRMIENPKYKGYYCAKKTEIVDYMTKKVKYLKKFLPKK